MDDKKNCKQCKKSEKKEKKESKEGKSDIKSRDGPEGTIKSNVSFSAIDVKSKGSKGDNKSTNISAEDQMNSKRSDVSG